MVLRRIERQNPAFKEHLDREKPESCL
jgi:hypothetical protein